MSLLRLFRRKRRRCVLSFVGGGKVSVPVADIIASPKVQAHVAAVRRYLEERT